MKKNIFSTILIMLNAFVINAQIQKLEPKTVNSKDIIVPNSKLSKDALEAANTWIEIYELPNYQGQKVRFTQSKETPTFPFALDRISIKKGNFITTKVTINTNGYQRGEEIEIKNDEPNIRIGNGGVGLIKFDALAWVEIFELPNQQGRSVKIVEDIVNKHNLGLPFSASNISVKLSGDDVIATLSFDCAGRKLYSKIDRIKANPDLRSAIPCGLHIGKKAAIRIRFNGILSEIHNNDCKRMYGNISYRLVEKDVNGNIVDVCKTIKPAESDQWSSVTVYSNSKNAATAPANLYDVSKFYIKERDGNRTNLPRLYTYPRDEDTYILHYFDEDAYQQDRIFLEVTTNIGSHHKGCDLCSDYTDNATMIRNMVKQISVARAGSTAGLLQVGKFRSASGEGGFTGPEHATYLDFTFTKVSYDIYRQRFPY